MDQKKKKSVRSIIQRNKRRVIFLSLAIWLIVLFIVFIVVRFYTSNTSSDEILNKASNSEAAFKNTEQRSIGETKSGLDLGTLNVDSSLATFEILGKTNEEKNEIYSHVKVEPDGMICDIYWPDKELSQDELDILVVAGGQLYEDKLNNKDKNKRYNIMSNRAVPEEISSIGGEVAYYIDEQYTLHLYGRLTIKDLQKNTESVKITELKLRYGDKYLELE